MPRKQSRKETKWNHPCGVIFASDVLPERFLKRNRKPYGSLEFTFNYSSFKEVFGIDKEFKPLIEKQKWCLLFRLAVRVMGRNSAQFDMMRFFAQASNQDESKVVFCFFFFLMEKNLFGWSLDKIDVFKNENQ